MPHATQTARWLFASALLMTGSLAGGGVGAQTTVDWMGATSSDWFTGSNWSTGAVPTAADDVVIDTNDPNEAEISNTTAIEIASLIVGDTGTANLEMPTGTLTVDGNLTIAANGGTGEIDLFDPSAVLSVGGDFLLASDGTGSMILSSGGTVTADDLTIGLDEDAEATLTIGKLAGQTAIEAGILDVSSIIVSRLKKATLTFNHTGAEADAYTFAPSMVVAAGNDDVNLDILAGYTIFGDLSQYGQSVTIGDGTMVIPDTLVADDITLGGGTTGLLSIESGGSVSASSLEIGTGSSDAGTVDVAGDDGNGNGSNLTISDKLVIGSEGTGMLIVADGGTVDSTPTIEIAKSGSSTGTLVFGAVAGSDAVAAGTVTGNMSFGSGTGTILFNHTATEADPFVFSSSVTGSGTLSFVGGVTELTSENTSLGGTVEVDGATLTITGALTTDTLIVANTETGTVVEIGNEIQALFEKDATIGLEAGSSGMVTVAGATGAGSSLVASTFNARDMVVGAAGTGTLIANNFGTVIVDDRKGTLTIAESAGSTGTLVVGVPSGDTLLGPGVIQAGSIAFGDGTGSVIFNHADDTGDFVFDIPFTGTGTITVQAGVTEFSGKSSNFTGTTDVTGGQLTVSGTLPGTVMLDGGDLSVSGTLSGDVTIGSDSTLSGTGTVEGTLTVDSGGTIAPGTSVGTLTTADVTFQSGSVYAIDIDSDGNTDLINASGTVTLSGGTVSVDTDEFSVNDSFVILTAAQVTGEFSEVTGSTTFIDYVLSYDDTDVTLTQTVSQAFGAVGTSENHQQVADALTSLPFEEEVVQHALASPTEDEARIIFDSLSGEIHASIQGALMDNDREISAAINRRLGGPFYGPMSNDPSMDGPQNGAWVAGYGGWNDIDATGNTDSASNDYGGVIAGFDRAFGETWRLGIFGAYGSTDVDQSARASSADVDSVSAGLYGQANVDALFINLGGVFSWHDIDTSRTVLVRRTVQNLTASYDANSWQLFAEAGYRFAWDGTTLEPFGGVSYLQLDRDGFTEAGGSAALSASANTEETTFTTLGVRVGQQVTDTFRVQGTAAWRHAFGDVDPTAGFTLAGSDPFTVAGAPIAEDALLVEAAVELDLAANVTLGVGYGGRFGDGTTANQVQGYLRVSF